MFELDTENLLFLTHCVFIIINATGAFLMYLNMCSIEKSAKSIDSSAQYINAVKKDLYDKFIKDNK